MDRCRRAAPPRSPATSARIVPKRSTCVPPALVETSPPIVADALARRASAGSAARRPRGVVERRRGSPRPRRPPDSVGGIERRGSRFIRRSDSISADAVGRRRGAADHRGVAALRHQRDARLAAHSATIAADLRGAWPATSDRRRRRRESARASRSARARSSRHRWSAAFAPKRGADGVDKAVLRGMSSRPRASTRASPQPIHRTVQALSAA